MLRSAKSVLAARSAFQAKMAPPLANGSLLNDRKQTYSLTALKRWSCQNNGELPAVSQIKTIHVYDFDNTLFSSPLPNPQLWNGPTVGFLQTEDCFSNGGWWHDPNILAATGQGIDVEEPLAWKGWWNEQIVQLVELSMKQKDALTVLLTGRAEGPFADIIKRIVKSRELLFDLICLKPEVGPNSQRFSSTMNFKQTFLEDLALTYKQADEIRVYEDRPKHVKGFRDYFDRFNKTLSGPSAPRHPIVAEVVQVAEESTFLSPVTEAAEIQRMINSHNTAISAANGSAAKSPYGRLRIKRTIFYTGYILSNADSSRLINFVLQPMLPSDSGDIKLMANSILITPRPAPQSVLDKAGGIGKTVRWRITDTAVYEDQIWAARAAPTLDSETVYTENPEPVIVLAVKKGARPADANRIRDWIPVAHEDALVFDSTVGQKMVLRVEEEHPEDGGAWEGMLSNRSNKQRKRFDTRDEDMPPYPPKDRSTRGYYQGGPSQDYSPRGGRYHGYGGYGDENSRRGGGGPGPHYSTYRGSRGRGRGGRGGDSRGRGGRGGRGRGAGPREGGAGRGGPSYRSLDDYNSGSGSGPGGYDGTSDERGFVGGTGPVMNY